MAYFVGGVMAVGAMFGALNTMYSAVSARSREIATLRAIGFGSGPVVFSVFAESLLLALMGGAIGALLAWLFFTGNAVSTLGPHFSKAVFRLPVTTGRLLPGNRRALFIGLLLGLFPPLTPPP